MGGVIGATTGKFVMAGAALLLQGRVDNELTTLAIVPSAQTSGISLELASRIDPHHTKNVTHTFRFRMENFSDRTAVDDAMPAGGPGARIGSDILARHLILIDFRHHAARILMPFEVPALLRKFAMIPMAKDPMGYWSLSTRNERGEAGLARLDLQVAEQGKVVGPSKSCLSEQPIVTGEIASARFDLADLGDRTVVFDFGAKRLWVSRTRPAHPLLCQQ